MIAAAFALAASLSWGVADFVAGVKSRRIHLLAVMAVSMPAGLAVIAAIVVARGEGPPGRVFALYAAAAAVAATIGIGAFYRGMAVGAIAIVAPISGTGALIPVLVGLARGERPAPLQYAGMVLAVVGIALASREAGDRAGRDGALASVSGSFMRSTGRFRRTARKRRRPDGGTASGPAAGVGLALLAAIGFGCFFVAMDAASTDDPLWPTLVLRITSTSLVVAAVLLVRPAFPRARTDIGPLLAVGVLDMAASGFYAAASSRGLVSVVAVLASLYPVVTVALALGFLRERISLFQTAGIVLALAGVILISAG